MQHFWHRAYRCGSAEDIDTLVAERGFNFCFTSPPYYADCRDEASARIIRQALWCRGWLPCIVVWLAAALVWSVAQ